VVDGCLRPNDALRVTGPDATQRAALLAAFQSRCPIDTTLARAVPIELVLA